MGTEEVRRTTVYRQKFGSIATPMTIHKAEKNA
jgi:hypothetical protein